MKASPTLGRWEIRESIALVVFAHLGGCGSTTTTVMASCTTREVDAGTEIRCPDGTRTVIGKPPACTPGSCGDAGDDVALPGADADASVRLDARAGCSANTASDLDNCGACGNACPVPENAETQCVDGVCGRSTCLPGYEDCNGSLVDGCEVEVARDPGNCGRCNDTCRGAGCFDGECGEPPESLLPPPYDPTSWVRLAQDSSSVYTISCDPSGGRLLAYFKALGTWTEIANAIGCAEASAGLATDGTNVYYVEGAKIWTVPRAGGPPTQFFEIPVSETYGVFGLQADEHRVYYAAGGKIHVVPIAAGGTALSISTPVDSIDVDSGYLYWSGVSGDFGPAGITRVPTGGGDPVLVARASAGQRTSVFQAFGSWVVWLESPEWQNGDPGEPRNLVRKAPASGGTVTNVFDVPASTGPQPFAMDSSAVYTESRSLLLKVPLSGEAPIAIAAMVASVTDIVVDETHVYWANSGGLWRVGKR